MIKNDPPTGPMTDLRPRVKCRRVMREFSRLPWVGGGLMDWMPGAGGAPLTGGPFTELFARTAPPPGGRLAGCFWLASGRLMLTGRSRALVTFMLQYRHASNSVYQPETRHFSSGRNHRPRPEEVAVYDCWQALTSWPLGVLQLSAELLGNSGHSKTASAERYR